MNNQLSYVPPKVQRWADWLHEQTGHQPQLTKSGPRKWRITMQNDRVTMTVDYKITGPGRCLWNASTLEVDGQRRELAADCHHFVQIFKDPDGDRFDPQQEGVLADMPPEVDPATAPRKIREMYQQMVAGVAGTDGTPRLGRRGYVRWTIGFDCDAFSFRLNMKRTPSGFERDPDLPVQYFVDGQDRSGHVDGTVDRLLALLCGTPRADTPANPAIGGAAGAAVNTSADVRRQTVIRV